MKIEFIAEIVAEIESKPDKLLKMSDKIIDRINEEFNTLRHELEASFQMNCQLENCQLSS